MTRQVFVTALGQPDNAGDTALRRAFLDELRTAGDVHVFVGNRPAAFTDNLGLRGDEQLYRDSRPWRSAVLAHLRAGDALYAFSAGEIEVSADFGKNYLRTALPLAVCRRRGNRAVHLGVGVRRDDRARRLIAGVLRRCDLVTWRDGWSAELMGVGTVQPDWAFGAGSASLPLGSGSRPLLAVAVRWDRPALPPALLDAVAGAARSLGLEPVCVAQTGRDGARAAEIAERLGCRAVGWDGPGHREAESALREVYRRAAVTLTDRLHGAVFAMTEGSAPVLLEAEPGGKAERTVSVVDPDVARLPPTAGTAATTAVIAAAAGRGAETWAAVTGARERLATVSKRLGELGT